MKLFCTKILFHKYIEPLKYIENWPNSVLFEGIERRLPVRRDNLLEVLECINYEKRMARFCFYNYISKIKSEIG